MLSIFLNIYKYNFDEHYIYLYLIMRAIVLSTTYIFRTFAFCFSFKTFLNVGIFIGNALTKINLLNYLPIYNPLFSIFYFKMFLFWITVVLVSGIQHIDWTLV